MGMKTKRLVPAWTEHNNDSLLEGETHSLNSSPKWEKKNRDYELNSSKNCPRRSSKWVYLIENNYINVNDMTWHGSILRENFFIETINMFTKIVLWHGKIHLPWGSCKFIVRFWGIKSSWKNIMLAFEILSSEINSGQTPFWCKSIRGVWKWRDGTIRGLKKMIVNKKGIKGE